MNDNNLLLHYNLYPGEAVLFIANVITGPVMRKATQRCYQGRPWELSSLVGH